MKRPTCDQCGKVVDYIVVDGYDVAERLLEGVEFRVGLGDDGSATPSLLNKSDENYFSSLNEKKWLGEIKDFVENHADVANCPYCDKEVSLGNVADNPNEPVQVMKLNSLPEMIQGGAAQGNPGLSNINPALLGLFGIDPEEMTVRALKEGVTYKYRLGRIEPTNKNNGIKWNDWREGELKIKRRDFDLPESYRIANKYWKKDDPMLIAPLDTEVNDWDEFRPDDFEDGLFVNFDDHVLEIRHLGQEGDGDEDSE